VDRCPSRRAAELEAVRHRSATTVVKPSEDAPRNLDFPSLDDLEGSLRSKRQLGKILGVHGQAKPLSRQIADGYVRLAEKAIIEYTMSRERLAAFLANGVADDYFRAQDHFETCISAIHRAILYLERLRRIGPRYPDGTPFVPRPKALPVLTETVRKRVREFRDAGEHLDNDILDGKLPPRTEVGVHLGWTTAEVAGHKITYHDASSWLRQLHELAAKLSRVEIVVSTKD